MQAGRGEFKHSRLDSARVIGDLAGRGPGESVWKGAASCPAGNRSSRRRRLLAVQGTASGEAVAHPACTPKRRRRQI